MDPLMREIAVSALVRGDQVVDLMGTVGRVRETLERMGRIVLPELLYALFSRTSSWFQISW